MEKKLEEWRLQVEKTGKKIGMRFQLLRQGKPPKVPDPEQAKPEPAAQRNFTDADARIMVDGATKSYTYAYNAQAAVDWHGQIIVAAVLTQEANDQRQLAPMLEQVKMNLERMPEQASADTGYFSDAAVTDKKVEGINLLVPPRRKKDGEESHTEEASTEQIAADNDSPSAAQPQDQPVEESTPPTKSAAETMRDKLRTEAGKAVYWRKS